MTLLWLYKTVSRRKKTPLMKHKTRHSRTGFLKDAHDSSIIITINWKKKCRGENTRARCQIALCGDPGNRSVEETGSSVRHR